MAAHFETSHHLFYNTEGPISAAMLSESLLGLDGMAQHVRRVVSHLTGVHIRDAEVLITQIKAGSYDENFSFRFFFGKGKAAERRLEELRGKLGLHNMTPNKAIAILVAAAIAFAGWEYAHKKGDAAATVQIENSFNGWGKDLGMTKEELMALIQGSIRNNSEFKRDVVRLTHPKGSKQSGTITLDGGETEGAIVPKVAIAAIPPLAVRADEEEPFVDRDSVQIVIRAIDLDRPTQGWHAIIPELSERRLPIQLAADIDATTVPIGKYETADVTVIFKVDQHGNTTPKRYLVRKFLPRTATAK